MRLQQTGVFGLEGGVQRVAEVPQLVAPLHDERHCVVVGGGQLVSVEDDDLRSGHHLLAEEQRRNPFSTLSQAAGAGICKIAGG